MKDLTNKTTIYDIARESGVSVSTVSRVINNSPNVAEKSKAKVRAVIDKYHFEPSQLARALTVNKTNTIGVIVSDIANPYFSALYLEIQRYAMERGYSVILCNTLFGGASHGVASTFSENEYFKNLLSKKVDGAIILGGENDKEQISKKYIDALNDFASKVPVVVLGEQIEECDKCIFLNRNLGGGFPALVQHLAVLGNRRIGFVGGEPGVRQTTARFKAYQNTLISLGLEFDPKLVALTNYYSKDGYEGMMEILDSGVQRPDAVIAINDAVAIGCIRAINDRSLRCPEDIALVSGDQFFESDYVTPRLTSLDQQNDYLGRLSILALISAIKGIQETITFEHKPRLIIRESCGNGIQRDFK